VTEDPWATSGALQLTGPAGGPPLRPPAALVDAIEAIGARVDADPFALLVERAELDGFVRRGTTSCGGRTRLLRAADGDAVAVALPRADDLALLPAWLGIETAGDTAHGADERTWAAVGAAVARCPARAVVERGAELGLAVARCGEVTERTRVIESVHGSAPPLPRAPLVVDLSSLWAGPLATRLLLRAGARVVKVESTTRPDGARRGNPQFFERMHAGKEFLALDFEHDALHSLLRSADVVVEASRPRALAQLGIDAHELVATGPRVWLSITGYGRAAAVSHRVAFGDDAAAAGGLVADPGGDEGPYFVADAAADPLTGMVAAAAVLDALQADRRVVLDVALARVAASVAGAADGERWLPA
jgi:hypothetical protein